MLSGTVIDVGGLFSNHSNASRDASSPRGDRAAADTKADINRDVSGSDSGVPLASLPRYTSVVNVSLSPTAMSLRLFSVVLGSLLNVGVSDHAVDVSVKTCGNVARIC